jgi:hypothetical protein
MSILCKLDYCEDPKFLWKRLLKKRLYKASSGSTLKHRTLNFEHRTLNMNTACQLARGVQMI